MLNNLHADVLTMLYTKRLLLKYVIFPSVLNFVVYIIQLSPIL